MLRCCTLLLLVASWGCSDITPLGGDSTGGGSGGEDGSSSLLDPTMPQGTSTGDGSSSTTSADASSEVDGGGNFLDVDMDTDAGVCGAGLRTTIQCSLWNQDCCDAEACKPWANDGGGQWNDMRCTPVSDQPGQLGDPCTMEGSTTSGVDSCDIGLMCFGVDSDTLEGTCTELCNGDSEDPSCTDPAQTCFINNEGALPLCHTECDPLQQDCPDGQGCYALPWNHFTCQSTEADFVGCPAGQTAVDPEMEPACESGWPCCVPFCDLADPASCDAPTECTPLYDGAEDVGYCRSSD